MPKPAQGLLLRPEIASIQVKISSTFKTFDMSDRSELGLDCIQLLITRLDYFNILFLSGVPCYLNG